MEFQTTAYSGHCILKGVKKGQTNKWKSNLDKDKFGQDLTIWHCVKIKGDSHNVL